MSDTKRKWKTDPLEKFTDIISPEEYRKHGIRRHLPPIAPYRPFDPTGDLELRREVDDKFRIKRTK